MANFLGDLSNYIVTPSVYGSTTGIAATAAGTTVDLIDNVANIVSAIQVVGVVTGTSPTLSTKVQESTDGTTWTDVSGASFTQVTTSTNVQVIAFEPTKRYVRTTSTTGGTSPVFPAVTVILAPRRNVPTAVGGFSTAVAAG